MRRKNLAASVATTLCALLFIVIGSCFTTFIFKNEIIRVNSPKVVIADGMQVFSSEGDKAIDHLTLSAMKLGLKPATGDEDPETSVPSTVHDKKGSEGQFAKFNLYAPSGANIFVGNISIKGGESGKTEEERENIFVAISELSQKAKPLTEAKVSLGSVEAGDERRPFTLLVWLGAKAGEALKGATISFDIIFENLT